MVIGYEMQVEAVKGHAPDTGRSASARTFAFNIWGFGHAADPELA